MNNEFKSLSHRIGTDSMLVQGAGGNTSFKDDTSRMWVKASGTWLLNSLKDDLFVCVDYSIIRNNMEAGIDDPVKDTVVEETTLRPSIETTLHAFMHQKIVLHVHMVDLIALAIRSDAEQILEKTLHLIEWLWVPYTRPGTDLTHSLISIDSSWQGNVIVLGNHGLVVGGNNCIEVENTLNSIQGKCKQEARRVQPPSHELLEKYASLLNMRLPQHEQVHVLATDPECFRRCLEGVLYPDQAVFLGPSLPTIKQGEDPVKIVNEYSKKNGVNAKYFLIEGVGVLLARAAKNILDEMLLCHANILLRIEPDTKLRALSNDEVYSLLDWEQEKYRMLLESASNNQILD